MWGLQDQLEGRCASFMAEKYANIPDNMEDKTVFIEFSRGGAHGMKFPLPEPLGYQYSYQQLSPAILSCASVLYVSVTAEQSRAKNVARGSEDVAAPAASVGAQIMHSLHHSVPAHVMWNAYGVDDIKWLVSVSDKPSTIKINAHGKAFYLPVAFFDNTTDYTTFCRKAFADWKPAETDAIGAAITGSFVGLVQQYKALHS
eukprot:TRINITY_DN4762_c0_g1_i3.p1 TRINITY_DN4762_c0_g1~~TRINITY_DN4762_c0_g1_i3.p1  ORF type:complete len:201 (+),score=64.35 TRINITY_DN4762_c0_g1_i3:300-902(+)